MLKVEIMSNYWAEFKRLGDDTFRFDTRVYLEPIDSIKVNDHCLGAIVGKNPGSAQAGSTGEHIQPIDLDKDRFLPTVLSLFQKSYKEANIQIPERGFIQVLNLFYLCDATLTQAISKLEKNKHSKECVTENNIFPWVFYAWGGDSNGLNPYKARFSKLKANKCFYWDKTKEEVVSKLPTQADFAKHTQGLKLDPMINYISKNIL